MAPLSNGALLNPEPSRPTERRQKHLPPKSYADAIVNGANGDHPTEESSAYGEEEIEEDEKGLGEGSGDEHSMPPKSTLSESFAATGNEKVSTTTKIARDLHPDDKKDYQVVEERYRNGDGLTSLRSGQDYLDGLALDRTQQKPSSSNAEQQGLKSGRVAGRGWDRSGIRWAPLNVPLKRRLQTLTVLLHTLSIALFLTTFFLLCAVPLTWPLLFPYVLYILFSTASTSGTLSRRSNLLRSLPIWSLFASYFPARLHRTRALPSTRKYIFGYHPHGIISHGAFAAFATEALGFAQLFPGITNTLLTLDNNFRIPLYRDYALAMGLASVSRESCENLLSKGGHNGEGMGRAITIVVGGAAESLDAQPGTPPRLVLRRRKGFVKLAIRAGADLVPVLAFGENELYHQVRPESHPLLHRAQLLVKRLLGFTVPIFFARGVFNYDVGLMPFRTPLNVVVGNPVKVVQSPNPDPAYVESLHDQYICELSRIWRDWKAEFAPGVKGELEILE